MQLHNFLLLHKSCHPVDTITKINRIFVRVPPGDTDCNGIVGTWYTSKINVLIVLVLASLFVFRNPLKW